MNNRSIELFSVYILLIITCACSQKIYVSKYAGNGSHEENFYYTYQNDSLQFSIDFFGSHNLDTNSLKQKKVYISKINRKLLSDYNIRKANFLFKYNSYDNNCYCYIAQKENIHLDSKRFIFKRNSDSNLYFYSKNIVVSPGQLNMISGFSLNDNTFFLVHSLGRSHTLEEDSFLLKTNALREVSSVKEPPYYQQFTLQRKNLGKLISTYLFNKSDYIKALDSLKKMPLDTIESYNMENYYYQALITKLSFLDNLDSTRKYIQDYNFFINKVTSEKENEFNYDKAEDALQLVSKISVNQKMLMINESHYDYRNRLFVYLLLDSLYKNGYRNLCLEDRGADTAVNKIYPDQDDGFYIAEPFMGSIVRKAQQLGFTIYGYDVTNTDIDSRERNQASNLYKLYQKDTLNKWIVYGGYDHINKASFGSHQSAYQYFSKLAGFEPYSINQSYFSDLLRSFPFHKDSTGYYAIYGNPASGQLNQSDLYIINNISKHPFECYYGFLNNIFKQYSFKVTYENTGLNKYLFVYVKTEREVLNELAIPVYITRINSTAINLYLPKDNYVTAIISY